MDKLRISANGKISAREFFSTIISRKKSSPKAPKFAPEDPAWTFIIQMFNPNKWTTDKEKNELIKTLINNYIIKNKEILGIYNRKKFVAVVGDDLPTGIVQMAKVYIAKKRKLKVGD